MNVVFCTKGIAQRFDLQFRRSCRGETEEKERFFTLKLQKAQTHDATFLATLRATRVLWGVTMQRCAQQEFFRVSHDATLRATVAEVELDPTSAIVARNVARKVASCVRALYYK